MSSAHHEAGRSPVLIGVGQVLHRVDDHNDGVEPLELMARALEAAEADSGVSGLLAQADSVRVIRGVWRYGDPARVLADRFGAKGAETVGTPFGGNYCQVCVNDAARRIVTGEDGIVLIAGGENGRSLASASRAGMKLPRTEAPGEPDRWLALEIDMYHPVETRLDILAPVTHYGLYESAIRASRGESVDSHRDRIAQLWAGFSRVAQGNPNAWLRDPLSADEIGHVSGDNPMISTPYPRRMNANSRVDMGAALILTSLERARALGVPEDKIVYLHAGTEAKDTETTSERWSFTESPGMRIAGGRVLELAGLEVADVDHCDVYSCFPSAVQVAAKEIGLDLDKPLTVTGGLTFGGGPLNDYVLHSIARMVEVLRADPGAKGLVTANGGYLAKHAFGVYSTAPPASGFRYENCQAEVDAASVKRTVLDQYTGPVTVEAFTTEFKAGHPHHGFVSCLTPEGHRTWSRVEDESLLSLMVEADICGRTGRMDGEGVLLLD